MRPEINKISPEDLELLENTSDDDVIPEPIADKVLPEGFVNPPGGEDGHRCVDRHKLYRPTYKQLLLEKHNKFDQDPHFVGCAGKPFRIPREIWVDVPPEVITVLRDAVEERHQSSFDPGNIGMEHGSADAGPVSKTVSKRRRFSMQVLNSA
jgi:hypothetical protein